MKAGGSLSIWFFVGISLAVNGLLIFAAGIYALASPPPNRVVLYDLHADVWWGALLLILGVVYSLRFSPARERARNASNS
jgi:FtsH-binding integral membrane protein